MSKQVILSYEEHEKLINSQELYLKDLNYQKEQYNNELAITNRYYEKIITDLNKRIDKIQLVFIYKNDNYYFNNVENYYIKSEEVKDFIIKAIEDHNQEIKKLKEKLENKKFKGILSFLNKYLPK